MLLPLYDRANTANQQNWNPKTRQSRPDFQIKNQQSAQKHQETYRKVHCSLLKDTRCHQWTLACLLHQELHQCRVNVFIVPSEKTGSRSLGLDSYWEVGIVCKAMEEKVIHPCWWKFRRWTFRRIRNQEIQRRQIQKITQFSAGKVHQRKENRKYYKEKGSKRGFN